MPLTRRAFLAGTAAMSVAAPGLARASTYQQLRAAPGSAQLAPSGYAPTPIWGYDGGVPGPTIRVPQGGRVTRRLINELAQDTTVHWHGIRIDNAMDGVPHLTQHPVAPGDSFDYGFEVPDAGTYWYHPHNRSWEQMARGLYGALIVEEADLPAVDRDEVLLIDDWRFAEDATIHESFGMMHDWAHAGRIGNWVTVNGQGEYVLPVRQNERLRLRLANTANARVFPLAVMGMRAWLVALDGMPLAAPASVDAVRLGPAQRADLIVDITASDGEVARVVETDRDGALAVADFPVSGSARSAPLDAPGALAPNHVPPLGALEDAAVVELAMAGGAMGRMPGGTFAGHDGEEVPALWSLAGHAGMPDVPLFQAGLGETVRIRMINDTAWPHAMHLHGHHFRQVFGDGSTGPLRDTLLMERGETAEIAFVADNPGDWMLHCHMLEHSASGMMTWLRVA